MVHASDSHNGTSCTILLNLSTHIITIVCPSFSGSSDTKSMWIYYYAWSGQVWVVEQIVQLFSGVRFEMLMRIAVFAILSCVMSHPGLQPVIETSDVSWMDATFLRSNKVSECKSEPFEHAHNMSKWPAGLAYVASFMNYLLYLPIPFPRGLCINLEGSSTFLPLTLSMHIDRLGLFSHLYRTSFNYLSVCPGRWVGTTTLCMEVGWHCTVAVSAWCSAHQFPGCEYAVKPLSAPLRRIYAAYMGIYGYMQVLYMHSTAYTYCKYIYALKCTYMHAHLCMYVAMLLYVLSLIVAIVILESPSNQPQWSSQMPTLTPYHTSAQPK